MMQFEMKRCLELYLSDVLKSEEIMCTSSMYSNDIELVQTDQFVWKMSEIVPVELLTLIN